MKTKTIKGWGVIVKGGRLEGVLSNKRDAEKFISEKNLGYLTKIVACTVTYEI